MSFQVRKLNTRKHLMRSASRTALLSFLTTVRPLLTLGQRLWQQHRLAVDARQRALMLKRILLVLLSILVTLLVLVLLLKGLIAIRFITPDWLGSYASEELPKDTNGFTNIVLLGQGDKDHDGIDLTDTIIVASIDAEKTNSVTLISLPRDLQMTSVYFGERSVTNGRRINTLYRDIKSNQMHRQGKSETEAVTETLQQIRTEIGRITGLEIHHVIKVNFTGFVKAVDILGGIDLEVPYDIVDPAYPDNHFGFTTFVIRAGPQHLDGETALRYVRSRHTTSDFSRSARQQQIIAAMGEKAKTSGLLKNTSQLLQLWQTFVSDVETTLSMRELIGLARLGRGLNAGAVISVQLNDSNGLYGTPLQPAGLLYTPPRDQFGGAAVLLPVSIPELPVTWKQIQAYVSLLTKERTFFLKPTDITVLNAGAPSGSAGQLAKELTKFSFQVSNVSTGRLPQDLTQSVIFHAPEYASQAAFLARILHLSTTTDPQGLPPESLGPVAILLGTDYLPILLQNQIAPSQVQTE